MSIFIIAEIGINHNGSMENCKKLIDVAANAGCNAVKFQKRDIELVYTKDFLDSPRDSPWGTSQRDQKLALEFGKEEYDEINRYCKKLNIYWFASAWDMNSVSFLKQYPLKYNKIASAMVPYKEFLEENARLGRYTFISTGMCTMSDIEQAVSIFKSYQCPFELMHCVSTYPLKPQHANLNSIKTLRDHFNCKIGYSGHESGLAISYAAAALGITSLERHITLDRSMYGSDQSASIEPNGLKMLVDAVRKIEQAMGDGKIEITPDEIPIAKKLRAHIPNYVLT
ncbi:MAG: N-acetylneuraminate synthase family protein [Deltaproteobacteria bacterium]|nr:N-acetylneuraminate synthase family protein [Deltaproteobacteria bacterium]